MSAPPLDQMLAELIAMPTVSSASPDFDMGNRELVDRVAGWLESAGFRVEVLPLENHPNKANFIATLGEGEDGLILSGHTDTVPWDDGLWNHDPFKLTPDGGRLYGLGSADMKSFLGLAIEAARGLTPAKLRRPLILVGTADEESSMDGARMLSRLGKPRARHCVIGEPTDLRPVHMHKGIAMEAVRITGRTGHSSDPARGRNALDGMHRVIGELIAWREELKQRRNEAFAVPYPTLNLGHIHGGDNPNRICPSCELHFDLRPLPGMSLESLRAEFRGRIEQALAGTELSVETYELFPGVEAFQSPPQAAVVDLLAELSGKPPRSVAFGTEAPFYAELGIDTVVFGPGSIDQAHQPNEYIEQTALGQTVDILRALIRRLCLEA